ncbi:hypothetical protein [Miniphocaeibacter halophilus]|uniref:Uncharacterized protein n=1 Tax=Miniphocaeibacter halophilus TaxID=2931922 RepID=A0AC61MVP6_9FIRM|nr:hypothetical protein [Miniphocaeibacter halophilus]QQK08654.1 hypothetical protein JFY71_03690 [Miniphocaeibacter halophilus]
MDNCKEIHKIVNNMKRFYFPFNLEEIPKNGIYILFEKGEKAHNDLDRIVRVGTHTGENQLRPRISQHFIKENKDRSIFRKNIGRALLNKDNNDYLEVWDKKLVKKVDREKYGHLVDKNYQEKIEKKVTEYMRANFSFVVFEVDKKEDRLLYESRLISEVSNCKECRATENWLGRFSPKKKVVESGMWLVNELYKDNFTDEEFQEFKKYLL